MKMSKRIFKPALMLFVMSAALFSGSLWLSVQASGRPKSGAAAPISISITLTFGRASKGCRGFGICKITIGKLAPSARARTVRAELSNAGNGKLQLTLLEKAPEEGLTLFVDQDIVLSPEVARRLGFRNATIRKGEYAFNENKSVLNARLTRHSMLRR